MICEHSEWKTPPPEWKIRRVIDLSGSFNLDLNTALRQYFSHIFCHIVWGLGQNDASLPSVSIAECSESIHPGRDTDIKMHRNNSFKGQIKVIWRCTPTTLSSFPTKYELPTPYSFWDIARTRLSTLRSLEWGERSNQGHAIRLHTYAP